jgi:tryptophan halogenase
MMQQQNRSICIVGSGTAGLIASLMLRRAFPNDNITNISSSKVGIVGVGEGSTEHWRDFMDMCSIGVEDLLTNTNATHKYGIRFEGWTDQRPDYFHSVGSIPEIYAFGLIGEYMSFLENDKPITSQTGHLGLVHNQVIKENMHNNTNQFHFDTFELNNYLIGLCFKRMIKFIDDEVDLVNFNQNGYINSVTLTSKVEVLADIWIDATGFAKKLMKSMGNTDWVSFSKYLPTNAAIAFPTESETNNQIKPYTRARAASCGWMWEIPTTERRGNGYVYNSNFISEEEAVKEAELISGYKIEKYRHFNFDPGYSPVQWYKNCISVGLSSSFVEPLEATSIGSTIIQCKQIINGLASYTADSSAIQESYNRKMKQMMENILDMIRLHYISDREDTNFWRYVKTLPIPDSLQNLIDLWAEQVPSHYDVPNNGHLMFLSRHFVHVMQGQNLINPKVSTRAMENMGIRNIIEKNADEVRLRRYSREMIDHRESLIQADISNSSFGI